MRILILDFKNFFSFLANERPVWCYGRSAFFRGAFAIKIRGGTIAIMRKNMMIDLNLNSVVFIIVIGEANFQIFKGIEKIID